MVTALEFVMRQPETISVLYQGTPYGKKAWRCAHPTEEDEDYCDDDSARGEPAEVATASSEAGTSSAKAEVVSKKKPARVKSRSGGGGEIRDGAPEL
mmetsp:Transcript_28317/g.45359  ORF Transcript_28317/g.45359 Transcript_28317/m.45359 type:complete len:97 (+) Transcript_28317:306-596(+)